jgi:hypothetical protein
LGSRVAIVRTFGTTNEGGVAWGAENRRRVSTYICGLTGTTLPSSHPDVLCGVVPHIMVVRLIGSSPQSRSSVVSWGDQAPRGRRPEYVRCPCSAEGHHIPITPRPGLPRPSMRAPSMCWKLSATSGERPCCGRRRDCRRGYDAESANCPAFCRLRDCDEAHDRPACAPGCTGDHQQKKEAHNGCSASDDPALATIDTVGPGRRHPRGSGARGRIRAPHRNGHFGRPPPSCDHCSWCRVQLRRVDHLGYDPEDQPTLLRSCREP